MGADRAAFRLSANAVVQPMNIRRMYRPFRGQVRTKFAARQRYVEDVVVPPTRLASIKGFIG